MEKRHEFKYLGSTVQSNRECGKEMKQVQAGQSGRGGETRQEIPVSKSNGKSERKGLLEAKSAMLMVWRW